MDRLLVVALPKSEHYSTLAYDLLSQRLVLRAIAETKATQIAFWGCSHLAANFDCESQEHYPDLQGMWALSVLGEPPWLQAEASAWTEWLKPNKSLTGYTRQRLGKPLSIEQSALVKAGLTKNMAAKLLDGRTFEELRAEAEFVSEALAQKLQITKVTEVFKRRKDVAIVLSATLERGTPLDSKSVRDVLEP